MLFLRTMLSLATSRRVDDIFIYWPMHPLLSIKQDMQSTPHGIFLVIGFDRPDEEHYVALDHWLQDQDKDYAVFLLNEDFLRPMEQTKNLRCMITLGIDHNTMTNLSWLKEYQHLIRRDFQICDTPKWLSLSRTPRSLRLYAKQTWIDRWQDNFVWSLGNQHFYGDFDFYDNLDTAPSYLANALNFFSMKDIYNGTCASIVNETGYPTSYSEKVFHAILALHPVLVIGTPGLIAYLRQQGFDMFDDVLNHEYDSIDQDKLRVDTLFQTNESIIRGGLSRSDLRDRLLANRCQVWKYYQAQLEDLSIQIVSHLKG